jgi:hypothetical protein
MLEYLISKVRVIDTNPLRDLLKWQTASSGLMID